jgi:hypothetical protein
MMRVATSRLSVATSVRTSCVIASMLVIARARSSAVSWLNASSSRSVRSARLSEICSADAVSRVSSGSA